MDLGRTKFLLISLIFSAFTYILASTVFPHNAALTIAIASLMVFLWVTESLDLPVVGLFPLLFFPVLNLQTLEKTASYYSSPIIYLFLAGFIIGTGIEKSNLHRRLALTLINKIGTSGNRILLAFILCTGFISMWISNTATTLMMLPLALSIIAIVANVDNQNIENFKMSLLLSVAYASNFGGIATLIGSPPNLAMANYIEKTFDKRITFLEWISIGMPISILLLFMLFCAMIYLLPNTLQKNEYLLKYVEDQKASVGKISDCELKTLIIFSCVVFFWIFGPLMQEYLPFKINDTSVAIAGALSFFIISSKGNALLKWSDTRQLPWGILILFGGGLALAGALEENKILELLATFSGNLSIFSYAAIIFSLVFFSIFASEILNNIAQVLIFLPIVCQLAIKLKYDPILFSYALTIAAGSASMLPTGTPPNAIVFATEQIPMRSMLKIGLMLNLASSLIISLVFLFL